jgi:hypothetical protein
VGDGSKSFFGELVPAGAAGFVDRRGVGKDAIAQVYSKQIRLWPLIRTLYCPLRSPFNLHGENRNRSALIIEGQVRRPPDVMRSALQ